MTKKTIIAFPFIFLGVFCLCVLTAHGDIPFEKSLKAANVTLANMHNGYHESLILGNGDLYGIVWEKEGGLFMRITKNDIWDARIDTSEDGELPHVDIVTHKITGHLHADRSYSKIYPQPRCAAALQLGAAPKEMNGHLDISNGTVTIKSGGKAHTTLRILHERNVVLIKGPNAVSLEEIKAKSLPDAVLGSKDGVSYLLMKMPGDIDYKGMEYALALATKGDLKAVSLVTSFDIDDGDVLKRAISLAKDTIAEQEKTLVAKHEHRWREYWSRSGIELEDKELQRWWYRMLYFAQAVCKPGTAPVGIMPPLATDKTPWHADFHHNYNTWQAFWPLPAANHSELTDPWISYNNDMIPRYKNLAKVTYGIDGLHVPISSFLHEPDPALCKSKNQRQLSMNPWGLTIGLQGMTLQNMWQKYQCDQDVAYMNEKIYPFLKEVATFYVSFMEKCKKDDKGKILLGPSYSPEHPPMGIFNCPFDIAYVHYVFDAMIEAGAILEKDKELVEKCRKYKELLADYPTMIHNGEEIVVDFQGGGYIKEHNITVPAAPVFPADQVTWFSSDAEKKLFTNTIKATRFRDANSHVMFNIARARLSMPEAVTEAKKWFASRELPNGFFVWAGHGHGTYMGEMIGVAGLVNEFLLQSVGNKIRLFPCWPADKDAKFTHLRAQGGFIVSAEFKDGRVTSATIESVADKRLQLLSPWKTAFVNGESTTIGPGGLITLNTKAGQVFEFSEKPEQKVITDEQTNSARKPNIIFLFSDDLSYRDLSCYGQKHYSTPNLDRLATGGMRFTNAYSGSPECAPSRASLMTGMHMGHCRIRANRSVRGQDHLLAQDITIPEVLKQAGYATGFIGKWGIGLPGTEGTPDKQGFDFSYGYYDQFRAHGFFPHYMMRNGKPEPLPENYGFNMPRVYRHSKDKSGEHDNHYDSRGKLIPDGVKDPAKAKYSEDLFQQEALAFIRKNKSKPFFLYYATQLPHGPCITPNISKFKDKPWDQKHKEWAAMVEHMDRGVGKMVTLLDELGIMDDTIIFFAGDNGYSQWGYFGRPAHEDDPVFKNKGPWPKGKFTCTHEGGTRVPLFAYWKGHIQVQENNHLCALYDILPTTAELAGVDAPETDGISLAPTLLSKPGEQQKHKYLYWENGTRSRHAQSVRLGQWWACREHPSKPIELYDIVKDIDCNKNCAEENPTVVAQVKEILKEAHRDSQWYGNPGESEQQISAKRKKALAAEEMQTPVGPNRSYRGRVE